MKHFIIEEKFTGYANITIEAETEEEALNRYRNGDYKDSSNSTYFDYNRYIQRKNPYDRKNGNFT